ncbi:MAG TPA: hypothetical protein VLC52_15910 [Anaerolineae bacterium]|nr:hypothetical protein [Anaerolineae bacterium]
MSLGVEKSGTDKETLSCPRKAQEGVSSAIEKDARGRARTFAPARRATVGESRVPLLMLLVFVFVSLAIRSMIIDDPYERLQAIQQWPEVQVSSRNLVDECGVFMWVKWVGPGFGSEEPYIPMKYRYR